jgi:hypothetical protein
MNSQGDGAAAPLFITGTVQRYYLASCTLLLARTERAVDQIKRLGVPWPR